MIAGIERLDGIIDLGIIQRYQEQYPTINFNVANSTLDGCHFQRGYGYETIVLDLKHLLSLTSAEREFAVHHEVGHFCCRLVAPDVDVLDDEFYAERYALGHKKPLNRFKSILTRLTDSNNDVDAIGQGLAWLLYIRKTKRSEMWTALLSRGATDLKYRILRTWYRTVTN